MRRRGRLRPLKATSKLSDQVECTNHPCHKLSHLEILELVRAQQGVHPGEETRLDFIIATQANQCECCMGPLLDCMGQAQVGGHFASPQATSCAQL